MECFTELFAPFIEFIDMIKEFFMGIETKVSTVTETIKEVTK